MNRLVLLLTVAGMAAGLGACRAKNPDLTGPARKAPPVSYIPAKPDSKNFEDFYPLGTKEFPAEQPRYDENQITALFTVAKDGQSVNGLTERDFRIKENGVPVPQFHLSSKEDKDDEFVDIAFVVDITGSMGPFIENAKVVLSNFIVKSANDHYKVRMCLSTFGDFIVKHCRQFFPNSNPDQFISELTQIGIHEGQGEYKPYDWEENPMRALVEVVNSNLWASKSKRFVILVTDADFYSPDKPGKQLSTHQSRPETAAPGMREVIQAIRDSGVHVFAVTPAATGYNSDLAGEKGIVEASDGEWYNFPELFPPAKSGKKPKKDALNNILNRILHRTNTTYTITYSVDKTPGLDPTLPKEKRNVEITPSHGQLPQKPEVRSSMPTGRAQYLQSWKISEQAVEPSTVKVFSSGQLVNPSEYSVQGGTIQFRRPPAPGSKLRITYQQQDILANLNWHPMVIAGRADTRAIKVYLNGKEARPEDVRFDPSLDGNTNLNINPSVTGSNDPYEIRRNQGLKIRVVTNYIR